MIPVLTASRVLCRSRLKSENRIDNKEYEGTYKVDKKTKRIYVIYAETEYSDIKEEIILFGKDKIMTRKGLFPQPDTSLKKLTKKEVLW